MTTPDHPHEPEPLQLTDRSRFSLGWGRCPRARYMEYHSGPEGYGQKRKTESVPLATGIKVHEILSGLVDVKLTRDDARAIIIKHVEAYVAGARKSGLYELADDVSKAGLERVIKEQAGLIEGLAWAFWKGVRPWLLENYAVVAVEREMPTVIGCTCGGTELLDLGLHAQRWCQGVVLQTRPDLILQDLQSAALLNVDFKTGGQIHSKPWGDQWEDSVQFGIGSVAAEIALGSPIDFGMVIGINKGQRRPEYDAATGKEYGEKRQHSWLCYAYYKKPVPPFEPEDWKLSYWTTGEDGKRWGATPNRGYHLTPVFEATFAERPEGWTNMEWWLEMAPIEEVKKLFRVVGPLPTPRAQLEDLKVALAAEERRINANLWLVYHQAETHGLGSEEYFRTLNELFPQSWECFRYTGRCQFWRVCKKAAGWEGFFKGAHDEYVMRTPHHQQELEQAKARGVEFPTDATEEEEDG